MLYAAFVEASSAIKDAQPCFGSFPGASISFSLHEAVSKLDGMDLRSNAEKRAAAGFMQQELVLWQEATDDCDRYMGARYRFRLKTCILN